MAAWAYFETVLWGPAEVPGDLPEASTLRQQLVDQGVMGAAAFGHRPGRLGGHRLGGLAGGVDRFGEAVLMPGDGLFHGGGKIVGSGRGALSGLLPVGFPDPPSEPGVRLSPHRALHEIMPLGQCCPGRPAKGWGCCCPGSGIE